MRRSAGTLRAAASRRVFDSPAVYVPARSIHRVSGPESTGTAGNKHRSDAEALIRDVPVVEVDGDLAICDGGGGALGHPAEYIKLNNPDSHAPGGGAPRVCKYCGLRFKKKA